MSTFNKIQKKASIGMVIHACDPRTWEVGEGFGVQGQLRLQSELPGSLDCQQGGGKGK